ncbi:hypothetical protein ACFVYE_44600 [Streptomyces sp. NPDC058239]|uniref:hypothetical protein n=1 Tax=Streptomyces sp. NPDC058239 TaxID=3346395 RepID=UPI0036E25F8C
MTIEAMASSTAFTKSFGMQHPIASAPTGGSAGGATAAVSRGGGLGLPGAGNGDRGRLARELPIGLGLRGDAGSPGRRRATR